MIKASELRLNNWVSITGTIVQLSGEKFLYILSEDGLITRCEGIPLTPEILEKAGFVSTGSNWHAKKYFTDCKEAVELIRIDINASTFRASIENDDSADEPVYTAKAIKYLHQLQNLYFALTGQELETKL